MKNMETNKKAIDVIYKRTSIRHYSNQKVSDEQMETILRAGMSAPSGMNLQPWRFIVIRNRKVLNDLGSELPYAKMLSQADSAIVVCGELNNSGNKDLQKLWVQDCSAASENILLAITSLGLAGLWTAVYPYKDRMAIVEKYCKTPENIIPLNVIPIGYPAEEYSSKNKWDTSKIHKEQW